MIKTETKTFTTIYCDRCEAMVKGPEIPLLPPWSNKSHYGIKISDGLTSYPELHLCITCYDTLPNWMKMRMHTQGMGA